ncbi:hypothetical protein [Sphingomonas sp. URHD0057]|uniref:hypothetical protein n=1 Tax=Sphingomonas sp. URHD0057 TaxID=1380389 RepID=UPI000B1E66C2|nr:hypothetical protein [Sphingomonas sp. URHD0057]
MTDENILNWFPYAFPFFFVGMWLLATFMLGLMSGWFSLQQWYVDDGSEEPLLRLRSQSGSMGMGVALNGCLKLRAYQSGLGIGIWRIFGIFQKPLKVPWNEIEAEPSSSFFLPMVKLQLGKPPNGTLKISARSWTKLVAAAKPLATVPLPDVPPVNRAATARAMLIQWLVISGLFGAFIYLSSRSQPDGFPSVLALVVPAFLGVAMLVRFARS